MGNENLKEGQMKCIRCGIDLGRADETNAEYVIANEFLVKEDRTVFQGLNENKEERKSLRMEDLLGCQNIQAKVEKVDVQKTGIVCLKCYKTDDQVIWGIHKVKEEQDVLVVQEAA